MPGDLRQPTAHPKKLAFQESTGGQQINSQRADKIVHIEGGTVANDDDIEKAIPMIRKVHEFART